MFFNVCIIEDEDNGLYYDGDYVIDCDMNVKILWYFKVRFVKGKFFMGECIKFICKLC